MTAAAGVYIELAELLALRGQAGDLSLRARALARGAVSGQHASRLRGPGLSFEELRPYWPGDDARLIDWKVTARLRRPFLRLFNEERDRAVLLLVDQRMNQFFGSRRAFKSVVAAEAAALLGWSALDQHDRVGAILFGDHSSSELRPAGGSRAFVHMLGELTRYNQALHAENPGDAPERLNAVLHQAQQLARRDHLVILLSDFYGHDIQTRDLLIGLRRHNEVLACWTYDPLLADLPLDGELVASDGRLQMTLNLDRPALRQRALQLRDQRQREIMSWSDELGIAVLPLSSAAVVPAQLRELLGNHDRGRRLG
ncbi:DUF58 domain-containing protein [Pseudomonas sp. GLN_6]|uniref:DUF58 domain-containing protein n=1 Tax=Pseudomonas sp. GLN_6 TaxID=3367183 RepID=UPI00370A92CB